MASKYTVTYEPDEAGWWVASAKSVPGALTQGRSIEQARNRMREALSLLVEDADEAELVDDIKVPKQHRTAIERVRALQQKAVQAQEEAAAAARVLVKELRQSLSVRDVANVLALSAARVHQLFAEGKKPPARKKPATEKRKKQAAQHHSHH